MAYSIKEIYLTIQGEGLHAGRTAVFCRFAGCNLWSGRESDRAAAVCTFCDTDFVGVDGQGGGQFASADDLAAAIAKCWPANGRRPFVVFTGGEPLLQLDEPLVTAVRELGFYTAVETNGTKPAPTALDWICVSPKPGADFVQRTGDELKLVYPQPGVDPADYAGLDFRHFFLQPMDGPDRAANTQAALDYCQRFPQWRLSMQIHKLLGVR